MTSLSVLKFPSVEGAQRVESTLLDLQAQHVIEVQDAAMLLWAPGAKYPETRRFHSLVEQGALTSTFWDMLFGVIFTLPHFKHDGGAAVGEPSGQFADYGIGDEFIKETREKVIEGTSALFLLTSSSVMEKMLDVLIGQTFEIIMTNLSKMQEQELWITFGVAD
jgi:uncharacterized membrane protein